MSNLNLTDEQKEILGIKDERVDFYFKVENAVIDEARLFSNIHESHLYLVLSRYCNNNQIAFPSYSKLAELCYCSRRTIIKCMTSLEDKGYINKVKRKNDDNKKINDTNLYTINNIKEYAEIVSEKKNIIEGGSVSSALGVVHQKHQGGAHGAPNKELLIKNNIKKNKTTTRTPDNSLLIKPKLNSTECSSRFPKVCFLEKDEYCKLNLATKKHILKNFPNISETYFKEIYNKVLKLESEGLVKTFNGFLFNALKENWELNLSVASNFAENIDFNEKISWFQHSFRGVDSKQYLDLINKIPFEVLKLKRKKLGSLSSFDFAKELKKLAI